MIRTKNIKRTSGLKTKMLTIRTKPEIFDWLKEHDFSPSKIFNEALIEIGCPFLIRNK